MRSKSAYEIVESLPKRLRRRLQHIFFTQAYIISYPKSGRTWLRAMLGRARCRHYGLPDELMLKTIEITQQPGVLGTEFIHDFSDNPWRRYSNLPANKTKYRHKKVVFLKREVRDVLVSHYFHSTRRTKVFSGSLADFIRDDHLGAKKVLTFYLHWRNRQPKPMNFLQVTYEKMSTDPEQVLRATLDFLEAPQISDDAIAEAVEFSRFENLQKLERNQKFSNSRLKPGDVDDPESYKVRNGKVGGFRHYLTPEDLDFIRKTQDEINALAS